MQDMKKQAKIDVLKELMQMAKEAMKNSTKKGLDDMKSAQKVTVAAPDKESLLEGLEKAEDLLETPEMEESEEMSEESKEEPMMEEKKDMPALLPDMFMEEDEDFNPFVKKSKKEKMEDEE